MPAHCTLGTRVSVVKLQHDGVSLAAVQASALRLEVSYVVPLTKVDTADCGRASSGQLTPFSRERYSSLSRNNVDEASVCPTNVSQQLAHEEHERRLGVLVDRLLELAERSPALCVTHEL